MQDCAAITQFRRSWQVVEPATYSPPRSATAATIGEGLWQRAEVPVTAPLPGNCRRWHLRSRPMAPSLGVAGGDGANVTRLSTARELDKRILGPPHGLVYLPDRVVDGNLRQPLLGRGDGDRDSYGGGDGA